MQYSWKDTVPQEAAHEIPSKQPFSEWPQAGAIEYRNVHMCYRPGLPNVLNGGSVSIREGKSSEDQCHWKVIMSYGVIDQTVYWRAGQVLGNLH